MFSYLDPKDSKVIDVDYLLNKGWLAKATKVLLVISVKLREAYS
jgi:hypothetical protein